MKKIAGVSSVVYTECWILVFAIAGVSLLLGLTGWNSWQDTFKIPNIFAFLGVGFSCIFGGIKASKFASKKLRSGNGQD